MLLNVFHWITLVILWACIIQNIRIVKRNKRRAVELEERRVHGAEIGEMTVTDIVNVTGLSALQVQVAVDASLAALHSRIEELQRSNRERH
jgi:hypothetical protein